jgi:MFS family permease
VSDAQPQPLGYARPATVNGADGAPAANGGAGGLRFLLRALRYRNYRLFFLGQLVSMVGTWLTMVASSWLVYRLTDSSLWLGIAGFSQQVPMFVVAPLAGAWLDRWNRHTVLVITQILSMAQSLALAALALTHVIRIEHIIALNIFQGLINAFDMPARQAFVFDMVEDPADLSNAVALNGSVMHLARLIGPSIGGFLIQATSEGVCFLIDGVSFIAVIIALLMMTLRPPKPKVGKPQHVWAALKEGFAYAFGFAPIRVIMILTAVVSLVGMSQNTLAPIFAKEILHGSARTLGFLMAASGAGAFVGTIYLAARRSALGLGRVIAVSGVIFGLALLGFAASRTMQLSVAMMGLVGFGMVSQMASANTVLQTIVDDDKRARVMSIFVMSFMGTAPFASLLAGAIAERIGAPRTVAAGSVIALAGAAFFAAMLPAIRPLVRPIYIRKGILPEVAAGISTPPSSRRRRRIDRMVRDWLARSHRLRCVRRGLTRCAPESRLCGD